MSRIRSQAVDEYLDAQPVAARRKLALVRRIIRSALPEAEETISYKIPAYKLHGRVALYFAGWTKHYSLYPVMAPLVKKLGKAAEHFTFSKGTIRFPLAEPVPARLIADCQAPRAGSVPTAPDQGYRPVTEYGA